MSDYNGINYTKKYDSSDILANQTNFLIIFLSIFKIRTKNIYLLENKSQKSQEEIFSFDLKHYTIFIYIFHSPFFLHLYDSLSDRFHEVRLFGSWTYTVCEYNSLVILIRKVIYYVGSQYWVLCVRDYIVNHCRRRKLSFVFFVINWCNAQDQLLSVTAAGQCHVKTQVCDKLNQVCGSIILHCMVESTPLFSCTPTVAKMPNHNTTLLRKRWNNNTYITLWFTDICTGGSRYSGPLISFFYPKTKIICSWTKQNTTMF